MEVSPVEFFEGELSMNQISRKWMADEVEFLKQNYLTMSDKEIGNVLSRTRAAIERKRAKLKLEKNEKLTIDAVDIKEILTSKLTYQEIAEKGITRINSKGTSLEQKLETILKDLGVNYKKQVILGSEFNFKADFVIGKVVLEAHGDYWHGNPILFPIPNEMQKLSIEKDQLKKRYFEELGYKVYEIWELDVNTNFPDVKRKIARLLGN